MTIKNAEKRLAARLKAATEDPYAACLTRIRDWEDQSWTDPANQVALAEIRTFAAEVAGPDVPVLTEHVDHGTDAVQIHTGRECLSLWETEGTWGFTWFADLERADLLGYGNFAGADGEPLSSAGLARDGQPHHDALREAVTWLTRAFLASPAALPEGPLPPSVSDLYAD